MLTVVTPAASDRLTTVARARLMLGFAFDQDVLVDTLIGQASRATADHCRRAFGLETVRETLRDRGLCRTAEIVLSRYPVVGIVSVVLDGTMLASGDFELDEGTLYRLSSGRVVRWSGRTATITYTTGYVLPTDDSDGTLPAAVERAAILIVGAYLGSTERDPLVKGESVEGIGRTDYWVPGAADALPSPEAARILEPYRRHAWSVG